MAKNKLKLFEIPDKCTGCGACVSICPKQALALSYNDEGFYYPKLDESKCVDCKACEKSCHVLHNLQPKLPSQNYTAYMIKAKDIDVVGKSSSGGAFTLLANVVLNEGGVVYGARYNYAKERLEHCSTEECSMDELRKSKYIESYIGATFKEIISHLRNNRKVLFCGTPCQVEGLHFFLKVRKIDTSNLLLVRFVCHGVPANKFFTEYKHYEEQKYGSELKSFDFRPKTRGWRNSDWKMVFSNGKVEKGPYYYYYYYYYFQRCTILRKSCYTCKRIFHEIADITMADFWGIHKYRPENVDQEGISLVMDHSGKFETMLPLLENNCNVETLPFPALDYIYKEAKERGLISEERDTIMTSVRKHGYMHVAKKSLTRKIWMWRIKNLVKKIIGKKI